MADQSCQKFSGLRKVIAELAASERMRPAVKSVDRTFYKVLIRVDELLCDTVHAADDRNDPELVADGCSAVLSEVAVEGPGSGIRQVIDLVVVNVFTAFREAGVDVVGVDPLAFFDIACRDSDRIAVLDDRLTFCDIVEGDLVSSHNVLSGGHCDVVMCHGLAAGEGAESDSDIIGRMNFNRLHMHLPVLQRTLL